MRKALYVEVATRGDLIVNTGFRNYDVAMNAYVGCQMGCSYCYVRWLVKDDQHAWGDFLRVRDHLKEKLPKELKRGYFRLPVCKRPKVDEHGKPVMGKSKGGKPAKQVKETVYRTVKQEDARLVIGTMTDPYQPQEKKHRLTRIALQALLAASPQLNKVGIFTRSPVVLDDLELIARLPRKRVHYTVTPYTPDVLKLIEPIAIPTKVRFDTIKELKAAGVRCHVNVAPAIPVISERFTEEFAGKLAELRVDEFFVDPMQAYKESWEALTENLSGNADWPAIKRIMEDKDRFADWKEEYRLSWDRAWKKVQHLSPDTLPIWSDHLHHTWVNMKTGEQMVHKNYNDDALALGAGEVCDGEENSED